jgi:hypothetical protein
MFIGGKLVKKKTQKQSKNKNKANKQKAKQRMGDLTVERFNPLVPNPHQH